MCPGPLILTAPEEGKIRGNGKGGLKNHEMWSSFLHIKNVSLAVFLMQKGGAAPVRRKYFFMDKKFIKAAALAAFLCAFSPAIPAFAEEQKAEVPKQEEYIPLLLGEDKSTRSLVECQKEGTNGFVRSAAGDVYYLKNGEKQTGIQYIGPRMYYFDKEGKQEKGVFKDEKGRAFNFAGPLGEAISGWLGNSYFTPADCHRVSGFQTIDGDLYYFSDDGKTERGVRKVEDKTYCFTGPGDKAVSGWYDNKYFSPDDKTMETGLQEIDGKVYLLGDDGTYKAGITKTDDGKAYNFSYAGGSAKAGWYHENSSDGKNKAFYFSPDDLTMQTGVCKVDGRYYILEEDGTATVVSDENDAAIYAGAQNQGDAGNFCVPSQGINVALYSSSCANAPAAENAQQICNAQDSACAFSDTNQYVIADHWNQGNFLNTKDAAGSYAYVTVGDKTTRYVCKKVVNGYNNGPQLGINGGPVFFDTTNYYGCTHVSDLITYTCNGCWQNIWVAIWEKA